MLIAGLGLGLPLLLIIILTVFGPWTDRWGWTRIKGREQKMMSTAFQGYGAAFSPELNAAVEYQKQVHDEEDAEGRKRRPYFPGVSDGRFTIRALRDTPADLACLARWLSAGDLTALRNRFIVDLDEFAVPCMIEADGAAVGYVQYAHIPEEPGTYRLSCLLGPRCTEEALRPLLAYLYEWEEAAAVTGPGIHTARPDNCRFHLLH